MTNKLPKKKKLGNPYRIKWIIMAGWCKGIKYLRKVEIFFKQADIDAAVVAARNAFKFGSAWRTLDASQRGKLIDKFAALMERDLDYIAVRHMHGP